MPKRRTPEQLAAATAAGPPPSSTDYPTDETWHDAQDDWVLKEPTSVAESLPARGDKRRRKEWQRITKQHGALMKAVAHSAIATPIPASAPAAASPHSAAPASAITTAAREWCCDVRAHCEAVAVPAGRAGSGAIVCTPGEFTGRVLHNYCCSGKNVVNLWGLDAASMCDASTCVHGFERCTVTIGNLLLFAGHDRFGKAHQGVYKLIFPEEAPKREQPDERSASLRHTPFTSSQ